MVFLFECSKMIVVSQMLSPGSLLLLISIILRFTPVLIEFNHSKQEANEIATKMNADGKVNIGSF